MGYKPSSLEKLANREPKGVRKLDESRKAQILLTPLNRAGKRPGKPAFVGKILLRPLLLEPERTHMASEIQPHCDRILHPPAIEGKSKVRLRFIIGPSVVGIVSYSSVSPKHEAAVDGRRVTDKQGVRQVQLVRYGRDVQTIFDLFGSKENDMTFALGWVLSKSRVMLEHFLADLLPGAWSGVAEAVIELQTGRGEDGITDIEITIPGRLFLIIEAKKGPELAQPGQLSKYVRVLKQASEPQQHLVAVTSVTDVSAGCHLQCPGTERG